MPIDSEGAARAAVNRWLDGRNGEGKYRVTALVDLGPAWRVMWAGIADPGYVNLSRVDKESGEVEPDLADPLRIGPSARDTFADMMRTTVKPELKALGLKAKGTTFYLPSPDHFAALSVQQSGDNVWVRSKFTINVLVVANDEWAANAAFAGDTPNPNVRPPVGWWNRLGMLAPPYRDKWWMVWAGFPTDEVARDVVATIRDYGLRAMREHLA